MSTQTKSSSTGFQLKPKHFVYGILLVMLLAVVVLIVGVFNTLNKPVPASTADATNNSVVEIWSPPGVNRPVITQTIPNSNIPAPTPYPSAPAIEDDDNMRPKGSKEGTEQVKPTKSIDSTIEIAVKPTKTDTAPVNVMAKPQSKPTNQVTQPVPKPKQTKNNPKDVMDNLF